MSPLSPISLTPTEAYRRMKSIRRFEERALELSVAGDVAGSMHLCIGQEAIPVGALSALQPQDRVLSTYRGHGWALACGSSPLELMAEIAQRAGGTNGGRGGSPLLSDPDAGFLGENSIVGAGIPISAGVAMASVISDDNRVVVTSIGDGAMNQGATTEGMIFAAARNLPVIFICENNGWSEMTPIASVIRGEDLAQRATGLGIESHVVDGCDPFAVRDAVSRAADTCRRGAGPVFLECKTVRMKGHYNGDIQHYRPKEDLAAAAAGDPIERLLNEGLSFGTISHAEATAIDAEVEETIDSVVQEVLAMPLPDGSTARDHLYGDPVAQATSEATSGEAKEMTYQRAANLALKTELESRPEVLVYGEDVGFAGGIFGVTRGLQKQFGSERVFDTPISESAILGSAVGAAMEGLRPVVEIMWADFVFVALDQIINQAANVRYLSRSKLTAPMTVRMQQGVTPGACAQHAQSVEAIFAHVPGLKVGLPATPQDAYDMLRASIGDPDPTVLIESRSLYQQKGPVIERATSERAEGARFHREGPDVSIITWGQMLHQAIGAADVLAARGINATVLDLRWLRPLDEEAIAAAVRSSSGRVLIVHEATLTGGFGAEVAAGIMDRHFTELTGSVVRLGTPDVRMPSAPSLQRVLIPNEATIVEAATDLLRRSTAGSAAGGSYA